MKEIEGTLQGDGLRFALVVARFNQQVTDELLSGATDCLLGHGVSEGDIEIVRVPGAWELCGACARLVERGGLEGIVALGCVIRGATPHFEFVAGEAARGLGALNRKARLPIGFGVLTTDTLEQAFERAGSRGRDEGENKGWEAALATLEMATLYREIG